MADIANWSQHFPTEPWGTNGILGTARSSTLRYILFNISSKLPRELQDPLVSVYRVQAQTSGPSLTLLREKSKCLVDTFKAKSRDFSDLLYVESLGTGFFFLSICLFFTPACCSLKLPKLLVIFSCIFCSFGASLVAQRVKNLPARQETWVRSLGQEDPLEKGMATYASILAWRIPWTEELSGLQSMGSHGVGYD